MIRRIALGIGLALAIIVLVSAGVYVLAVKINDGLQGNCNQHVISQYEAVRDSISSEISEAVIQRYPHGLPLPRLFRSVAAVTS